MTVKKSHIKRCIGVVESNDGTITPFDEMSVDVVRLEIFRVVEHEGAGGQGAITTLNWKDDQDDSEWADDTQSSSGNVFLRKKSHMVKVTDPTDPPLLSPSDAKLIGPKVYIPIRCVDAVALHERGLRVPTDRKKQIIPDQDATGMNEVRQRVFKNERYDSGGNPIETQRDISVIRLQHQDTNQEDALASQPRVVSTEVYQLQGVDPTEVDDQGRPKEFVDFEVLNAYKYLGVSDYAKWKAVYKTKQYYLDAFSIDVDSILSDGINSDGNQIVPIRLDPLQSVVNVRWPAATEIEQDSLIQASNPLRDSPQLLLDLWVRIPQASFDANQGRDITVWAWGAYGEVLTSIHLPPEGQPPTTTTKQGSSIRISADGSVSCTFEGSNRSTPLYHCDTRTYEVNGGTLYTTADPAWLALSFTNVLRFGVLPGFLFDNTVLGINLKSRFTAQHIPPPNGPIVNRGVGVLGWVITDPGTVLFGFQPKIGDADIASVSGIPPIANEPWVVTLTKQFPGDVVNDGDTPWFPSAGSGSERPLFEMDKWNNIVIKADLSIPTDYSYQTNDNGDTVTDAQGSPILIINTAPTIEIWVNNEDVTPTLKYATKGQVLAARNGPDVNEMTGNDEPPTCNVNKPQAPNQHFHVDPFSIQMDGGPMALPIQDDAIEPNGDAHLGQNNVVVEYCQAVAYTGFGGSIETILPYFVQDAAVGAPASTRSVNGIRIPAYTFLWDRFGKPDLHLEGRPEDFVKDRGLSEVRFSAIGELKRYVPRPPLGEDPADV